MDIESAGDAEEPRVAGIGSAGLDALDREPLDSTGVAQPLLGEVGVEPLLPDPVAEASALLNDPVRVGFAGHSTNADPVTIMSQPMQACFS